MLSSSLEPTLIDLDVPDSTGAVRSAHRVSVEAAFQFCERYADEMPEVVKRFRAQRRSPCSVEFVL